MGSEGEEGPEQVLDRAEGMAMRGQIGEALELFESVLQDLPQSVKAWHLLSMYNEFLTRHEAVVEVVERALETLEVRETGHEDHDRYMQLIGRGASGLVALKRKEEAVNLLQRGMEIDPVSEYITGGLMKLLHRMGRESEAFEMMDRAQEKLAEDDGTSAMVAITVTEFGNSLLELGEKDRAMKMYRTAYREDEVSSATLYRAMASLEEEMGNLEEATRIHNLVIPYLSKLPDPHIWASDIEASEKALARLEKKIRRAGKKGLWPFRK